MCREAEIKKIGYTFVGAQTPKICDGKEHEKFRAISDNFRLDREYLSNGLRYQNSGKAIQLLPLPR